jgi:hypothetical protein
MIRERHKQKNTVRGDILDVRRGNIDHAVNCLENVTNRHMNVLNSSTPEFWFTEKPSSLLLHSHETL